MVDIEIHREQTGRLVESVYNEFKSSQHLDIEPRIIIRPETILNIEFTEWPIFTVCFYYKYQKKRSVDGFDILLGSSNRQDVIM